VTCCTENEAGRYGRFLSAMLDIVMKWHRDKDVFEAECSGLAFFFIAFLATFFPCWVDPDPEF
jgi:THO complex subunit 2